MYDGLFRYFNSYIILMENDAQDFKDQVTENYSLVRIEDEVLDLDLELYNPQTDAVENKKISDYRGKWLVLFFYPADFTFVCPTELKDLQKVEEEVAGLGDVEILAGSTDTVFSHRSWIQQEGLLKGFSYPMFADRNTALTRYFGIMNTASGHTERGTFIISPEGILKTIEIHTEPVGRSARELVRKIKALKFVTENEGNACVASWDTDNHPVLKPSLQIAGNVEENLG